MNLRFSIDEAVQQLLPVAEKEKIQTVWDRHKDQQPQCGFGKMGVCCRICWKGPCRVDPFGNGAQRGICGADAHTIVARNLIRGIAAGAASHSDHGRHIALTMQEVGKGNAPAYKIKDEEKLKRIAQRLGIDCEGKSIRELTKEVAEVSLEDYSRQNSKVPCRWAELTMTEERAAKLKQWDVMPHNIDATVAEIMSRTHVGCDADPVNILLGGVKGAVADYTGMYISTELSDALFGTPTPTVTEANLGVIKEDAINIAVHGHNPLLSEMVCDAAAMMNDLAKQAGAPGGFNVVGVCCTGNEVMVRHGVPLATNYLSQEMPILTGALEAMVVDVQCIMPSLGAIAQCFHTQLITTMPTTKIPGATHIQFETETAIESAKKILELAVEAYQRRDPKRVNIPQVKEKAIVGFSAEAVVGALSQLDAHDPLKPLLDNIVNGNIQGICLFAGCNSTNTLQDRNFVELAKRLAADNVLLLATGCGAGALAKHGLMTQEATMEYAGDGLKAVLTAIGQANGLNGPLPLVLHMGSCVDNTRAVSVAVAIAQKLGVDLDRLPLVASAPEAMSEKAVAIGTWAVALGLPTHLGTVPQVLGSQVVTEVLTEKIKDITGGYFIVETDPEEAAKKLFAVIQEKRAGLNL
ncbi:anaerobic carbon-monoxide dehydrogenase catalytic subunit [Desulfitobacterium sp. PCE1]|uniref:anaerobic carbon-monoxide dehydrogenase catalytic subunit n=1 Tax=Desulfitobacterium sp. PCE1 TaxID=146907 RepID=UPI00037A13FD|nr:anaerobic carbon-monoxide dehydrogenase catalytic subunit [Desulfitobacterium sp. PCE1]